MLRFEQSIKSKHTLNNYKFHLERFLDFTKLKDYDSLINMPKDDIQMLVKKEKDLLKLECPDCFETYKDLYEEYLENS